MRTFTEELKELADRHGLRWKDEEASRPKGRRFIMKMTNIRHRRLRAQSNSLQSENASISE